MLNIFRNLFNSKVESFIIGKPFPWTEYAKKNEETIRPVLNMEGFDIVISLSNISEQEEEAFCHKDANLSVKNIVGIPFMVLNFDDVLKVDFTLNIMKMKAENRDIWLNLKDPNYSIRIFLVEATTTNLIAMRICPFNDMNYIREICASQVSLKIEQIDSLIKMHQNIYDINTLVQKADKQYVFKVISL